MVILRGLTQTFWFLKYSRAFFTLITTAFQVVYSKSASIGYFLVSKNIITVTPWNRPIPSSALTFETMLSAKPFLR